MVKFGGNFPGVHDAADEPTFGYKGKRYRMDSVLLKRNGGRPQEGAR